MATTTPTYGWPVPTSTDYVADGAVAIEALGDAIDATLGGFFNIKQIVAATTTTEVFNSTNTYTDTTLTATITPTSASNKIIVMYQQGSVRKSAGNTQTQLQIRLLRGATQIGYHISLYTNSALELRVPGPGGIIFDAPATTSATTYKTQFNNSQNVDGVAVQMGNSTGSIILIEVEV
jgi:hypothetical protein